MAFAEIGFVLHKSLSKLALFCLKSPTLPVCHISVSCPATLMAGKLLPAVFLPHTVTIPFNLVIYVSYTAGSRASSEFSTKKGPEKGLTAPQPASPLWCVVSSQLLGYYCTVVEPVPSTMFRARSPAKTFSISKPVCGLIIAEVLSVFHHS